MTNTAADVRAYGGVDSAVWVGAKGSTLPTSPTADPDAAFTAVGFLSDNGINENRSVNVTQIYAMQGSTLVRSVKSQDTITFDFEALEENAVVASLNSPGSTPVSVTGVTTTDVGPSTTQDLRAFIIDLEDGSVHKRYVIPNGEVTTYPTPAYVGTTATVFKFTVTAYPDSSGVCFTKITDDPAQVVA